MIKQYLIIFILLISWPTSLLPFCLTSSKKNNNDTAILKANELCAMTLYAGTNRNELARFHLAQEKIAWGLTVKSMAPDNCIELGDRGIRADSAVKYFTTFWHFKALKAGAAIVQVTRNEDGKITKQNVTITINS